jgi:hypothetical protein
MSILMSLRGTRSTAAPHPDFIPGLRSIAQNRHLWWSNLDILHLAVKSSFSAFSIEFKAGIESADPEIESPCCH